ncbi:hypothetical protein DACRYDRAFT_49750 [Dacryopinax primogenitus]|uniref:Tetratricopeptide SHNi-TPR domain-containing protein n=1 Tax=Dacryopinax primogenitus (strain DJM 731) TaxID=1858805 RepID=M5G4A7_DACPD|nr:uncharacterized protein DACRYDRAFT_49750 [Dacryopinax primogenitus]EJU03524.1 hypothetical protein DACRYDRAFT_49750 [Dacryopinax primogenitus]
MSANNGTDKSGDRIQEFVDLAQRAYALRKYEEAVENYAKALEAFTEKHGENSPDSADLLYKYGKALLENAISQNSALGKEPPEEAPADKSGKIIISGDAEDVEEEEDEEDEDEEMGEVIMEGQEAVKLGEVGGKEEEDQEMEDAEPEDDFNAAWEVLDLARAFFEKGDADETKLKLAETYIALGDISLETEKFDQALLDYTSALKQKSELLPISSRQIAEVHYKLTIVCDLTVGKLQEAITHAEGAKQSLEARLVLLKAAQEQQTLPVEANGNGKQTLASKEQAGINAMSKEELAAEIKDIEELRGEMTAKIDDLSQAPEQRESAPDAANRALDELLGGPSSSLKDAIVNDLTGVVKKKKKAEVDTKEVASPTP